MKFVFTILLLLQGAVHLVAFGDASQMPAVIQMTQNLTKAGDFLWMIVAALFGIASILFFIKHKLWWLPSLLAVAISQSLIINNWQEAKFGTIANAIILIVTLIGYSAWHFHKKFKNEVVNTFKTASLSEGLLTESDIKHLPEPVKKYLIYTGALNKKKVQNFNVIFGGDFRASEESEWMDFTSDQFNFIDRSTRLFFMKAIMKKLPITGFHCYKNGVAFMDVRLMSLIPVEYQTGDEMNKGETVTFFNDMCVMAPASLIDSRIKWETTDGNKVKAVFTNNNISITAWLYFNDKGELVNFTSDDRLALWEDHQLKQARWSTPLYNYKEINGYRLATYGETIYSFPEGDFCYGKFKLRSIQYNTHAFA
jgi:hypothetical protein